MHYLKSADGDADYLNRCLDFYKQTGIKAIGKNIKEADLPKCIAQYLKEIKPDIVIITGHPVPFYTQKEKIS